MSYYEIRSSINAISCSKGFFFLIFDLGPVIERNRLGWNPKWCQTALSKIICATVMELVKDCGVYFFNYCSNRVEDVYELVVPVSFGFDRIDFDLPFTQR